jgi:hypothetical protein
VGCVGCVGVWGPAVCGVCGVFGVCGVCGGCGGGLGCVGCVGGGGLTFDIPQTALVATLDTYDFKLGLINKLLEGREVVRKKD